MNRRRREAARSAPDADPPVRPRDLARGHTSALGLRVQRAAGGRDRIAVLPAEIVGLHVVDLPVRSDRQRRAALPFALEEALGQPLDQVHVALCRKLPEGRVLAAVMAREVMEQAVAEWPGRSLVPEQFALAAPAPGPEGGTVWSTFRDQDRVVVRLSDGGGFAVRVELLPMLWVRAGRPTLRNLGAALPDAMAWQDATEDDPGPDPTDLGVDLRQGTFRPASGYAGPLKAVAASAAGVALLHLGLAWADLRAQRAIADTLREQTRALLADRLPEASVQDDPRLVYRQITARAVPAGAAGVVAVLERASEALVASSAPIAVDRLVWSADPPTLSLEVTAAGLEDLQTAEEALRLAGLSVNAGTATAGASGAQAALTVRPETAQ